MSLIKYQLSARQQKELLIRGRTLRIAIPIHVDGDDHDWLGFARRSMIADHAQYIRSAEPDVLWTDLSSGIGGSGVSAMLGRIVESADDANFPVSVEVVICELVPPVEPRGDQPLQWPGKLEIEGVPWPPVPSGQVASSSGNASRSRTCRITWILDRHLAPEPGRSADRETRLYDARNKT